MKPSPFERQPPTRARLLRSIALSLAGASLILTLFVLPAEYGIDPTGVGRLLGLTTLNKPGRTIQINEVIGGNERYREIQVPDARDPIPLPNPAVFQAKSHPARSETSTIHLQSGQSTEMKMMLEVSQVVLFAWQAKGGEVYTDFHGHETGAGDESFVRYEEQQSGVRGSGSLVAPFSGEHGWYWLNISEQPVEIELSVSGYYAEIVDHGVHTQ